MCSPLLCVEGSVPYVHIPHLNHEESPMQFTNDGSVHRRFFSRDKGFENVTHFSESVPFMQRLRLPLFEGSLLIVFNARALSCKKLFLFLSRKSVRPSVRNSWKDFRGVLFFFGGGGLGVTKITYKIEVWLKSYNNKHST
jgi:hypothetical protein